jgi:hypothetical protein
MLVLITLFVWPASAATRKLSLGVTVRQGRSQTAYNASRTMLGRAPAIWSIFSSWGGDNSSFPDPQFLAHLQSNGTVPVIIWQPGRPGAEHRPIFTYRKIVTEVRIRRYIREFANAAKDFGGPVIIRLAPEMDGAWFPWGYSRFDNTPQLFVRMWRYVVSIFRNVGATNARFLWNPYLSNPASSRTPRHLRSLYPGDAYVDYVGPTVLNWGTPSRRRPSSRWRSMQRLVTAKVTVIARITRKPIIIPEIASSPDAPRGQGKADWIRMGYPAVYSRWPRIRAIVYLNINLRGRPAYHEDWRLRTPASALAQYRALLTQPRFMGCLTAPCPS